MLGNVETLKTGQTERGTFSLGGYDPKETTESPSAFNSVSFQLTLAANPLAVVVVPKGATDGAVTAPASAAATPRRKRRRASSAST